MPPNEQALARRLHLPLALQYGRFALVGMAATAVHVLAYAGLIELLAIAPLPANTLGFALAVNLSFAGHRRWTFKAERQPDPARSLMRFWVVALFGFLLNTAFVVLVTGPLSLAYGWAIPLIAGVTPLATFTLGKLWAFRGEAEAG